MNAKKLTWYEKKFMKLVVLELGETYSVYGKDCQFIRTTRKGFNFYCAEENRLLFLKYHFYPFRFRNRELPKDKTRFEFLITNNLAWCIKHKEKKNAS